MKDQLAGQIQQYFLEKGWTLSLAESCTGGALAARLVRQPGASGYFLGSIVAYSNDLKIKLLGVDPMLLQAWGAVSGPVVEQMAKGVLHLSQSDYSLAVSGIAGPEGGSTLKPIGTIWAAIAKKEEEPFVWTFQVLGEREEIIQKSAECLLNQLLILIKNQ
ncbi:CinA family protein [Candidatus Protochlamydia phocaeensis]|uniref:CinA family protein n=1 Tax=Candidatus Protochlamydia phocaeensis TaxID=1414722 RepID=UPI000838CDAE|nr:CinA family protein [Candidatus Protochlamydia phocaeensis]